MKVLAFDTCLNACSAALYDARSGLCVSRFEPMQTGHAERLMPMVEAVMSETGVRFAEVDRLAVTCGPGTFTGTRISIAAARALALSIGCATVAETSLAVMAEGIAGPAAKDGGAMGTSAVLICTDARRGEVYAQAFAGNAPRSAPWVAGYASVAETLSPAHRTVVAGSGAEAVAEAALKIGRNVEAVRADLLPDAAFLARRAARPEAVIAPVAPLYLRPADAKPQTGKSLPRANP